MFYPYFTDDGQTQCSDLKPFIYTFHNSDASEYRSIMKQHTFPNLTPHPNTYTPENLKQEKIGVDTQFYLTDTHFRSW